MEKPAKKNGKFFSAGRLTDWCMVIPTTNLEPKDKINVAELPKNVIKPAQETQKLILSGKFSETESETRKESWA